MHRRRLRRALALPLVVLSLAAGAQQMKIESRGQAEEYGQREAAVAATMSKAVGLPASGKGQVVFFRSSASPGASIRVNAADGPVGEVPPGMYLAVPASPGKHAYGPGALPVEVKPGETKYVQVTRDRSGAPRLVASTATNFQSVSRRAK